MILEIHAYLIKRCKSVGDAGAMLMTSFLTLTVANGMDT